MMKVTFLGTGTSHGVPVIGCRCPVCTSGDPKNNRMRASVLVESEHISFVIDTGPEFRIQAIRAGLQTLDAALYTHDHADHLYGIDDLRVFTWKGSLPVYGSTPTLEQIKSRFAYIFGHDLPGGGVPSLTLHPLDGDGVHLGGMTVTPVPIYHGKQTIFGYRFGSFAYLTDCSGIPPESLPLLEGLDVLVVGALRYQRHPTHFSVSQAVEAIEMIRPKRGYLTHMCHKLEHHELSSQLPEGIEPAWDGLEIILPLEEL